MRERVGLTECSNFAKYKVTGAGSADWLQGLFTNRLPKVGRISLTAMLNPQGRIVGEFSVARVGDDEFFLFGSQAAEVHHSRWFLAHLPSVGEIRFEVLALSLVGLSVAGPHARDVLQSVTVESLATADFPFMAFRQIDIGMIPAWVGRMTLHAATSATRSGWHPSTSGHCSTCCGAPGSRTAWRLFGFRALMAMRMEKMFGTWYREYRPIYTPLEAGMDRYLKLDHDFVGRAALEAEMARGPERRMVYLEVDPDPDEPADVIGDEPIWHDGEVVGWVTSGAYAHYSGVSLALGYVPAALATPDAAATGGSRDRDHRAPPTRPPAPRARARSERSTNACCNGSPRRRPSPHRAARRRRRLPRRAGHRRRLVAADGEGARRQCQRPRAPLRHQGRHRGGRAAPRRRRPGAGSGALDGAQSRPLAGRAAPAVVAMDQLVDVESGDGAARDRGRRARRDRDRIAGDGAGRPDRTVAIEHRAAPDRRGSPGRRRRRRGVAREGDVHRSRRRPARDRRAPPAHPGARGRPRPAGAGRVGERWTVSPGDPRPLATRRSGVVRRRGRSSRPCRSRAPNTTRLRVAT